MRRPTRVLCALSSIFACSCANSSAGDVGDTLGTFFMDAGAATATTGGQSGGSNSSGGGPMGANAGSTTGGNSGATGGSATSGATGSNGTSNNSGGAGGMMPDDPDASVDPGTTGGIPPPPPLPAGVLISEIMPRPEGGSSNEWIEIFNGSDQEIDLNGCTISRGGTTSSSSFTISGSIKVGAKGYAVLAREDAKTKSGITASYVYEHFYMTSSASLTFQCAGAMVDTLSFSDATYKASLQLDERYVSALKNDDPATWCSGSTALPVGEGLGSPGTANTLCSGLAAP